MKNSKKYQRRGIATIHTMMFAVLISVIASAQALSFTQEMVYQISVPEVPSLELLDVYGYDAAGILSSNNSGDSQNHMLLYVKNLGQKPVILQKITVGKTDYYKAVSSEITPDETPKKLRFCVMQEYSKKCSMSSKIGMGEKALIMIGFDENQLDVRIGKPVLVWVETNNENSFVKRITYGVKDL
jgi:hypothetical protein